jgi:hypothetical protein
VGGSVRLDAAGPKDPAHGLTGQARRVDQVDLADPRAGSLDHPVMERRSSRPLAFSGISDQCARLILSVADGRPRSLQFVDGLDDGGKWVAGHVGTFAPCPVWPTQFMTM